jgi:hypothetical protein
MVDIRLFGKLRRFIKEPEAGHANIIRVAPQPEETLQQLLARIGIPIDEIYTIVHEDPLDWNLEVALKAGDRIGLFGRDMAALVV